MKKEKEVYIAPYHVKGTDNYLIAIDAINQAIAQGDFCARVERSIAVGGEACVVSVLPQYRDQPPTIKVEGADGRVREFPRVNFR